MVYKLLSWDVVGRAYHKIQDTECLVCYCKNILKNEISLQVNKYLKIF